MYFNQCILKGPSRTRGQFQIFSAQIRLEIGQGQKFFFRKATVALKNKTCEQNITPRRERRAISRKALTSFIHPQNRDTKDLKICYYKEFWR